MNTYTFDEISIGQEEEFCVRITEREMELFRQITKDDNPLHCSEAYAKSRGHKSRVAYGMLTASYLSTLAGMYLPGKLSFIHEVEVKFLKPVFPDEKETLRVCGTVTEKNDTFKRITLKVAIVGSSGTKYLRGIMKVGVTE